MAYERIVIVGNIGSVELLKSTAGNPYLKMSIAVNRQIGSQKQVVWYSALLFGAMAKDDKKLLQLYKVGRTVLVEGRPQVEAFTKRDGSLGLDNSIICTSLPECVDAAKA